jgi:molybdate transport repressor ModE-like protein
MEKACRSAADAQIITGKSDAACIDCLRLSMPPGSLSGAAKQTGMSYMRAWILVHELNRDAEQPMIQMSRGAPGSGSAR